MKSNLKLKNYSKIKKYVGKDIEKMEIDVELYLWQYASKNFYFTLYVVIFHCEEFVISVVEPIMIIRSPQLG